MNYHEVILSDEELEFLVDMCAAHSLSLESGTKQYIMARRLKGFFETIQNGEGE